MAVRRYGCYANGFRFDSHFVDFTFFQAYMLPLWDSVVRLMLA